MRSVLPPTIKMHVSQLLQINRLVLTAFSSTVNFFDFILLHLTLDMPEKKMRVKRGCVAVKVGLEEEDGGFQRFVIPISYLYHPLFRQLLEMAKEIYGYHSTGPLKLPCSVDHFLHLRWKIEKGNASHHASSLLPKQTLFALIHL